MRKAIMASFLAGALALAALPVMLFTPGCGSTPETKIAQGEKILITSVSDGMAEWRDYVNAGKATRTQINQVKTAYVAYYDAQQVIRALLMKLAAKDPGATPEAAALANVRVQEAEAGLENLLNQFLLKL